MIFIISIPRAWLQDSALAKWLQRGADGARLDVASEIGTLADLRLDVIGHFFMSTLDELKPLARLFNWEGTIKKYQMK
jgi:glycosidase